MFDDEQYRLEGVSQFSGSMGKISASMFCPLGPPSPSQSLAAADRQTKRASYRSHSLGGREIDFLLFMP